MEIPFSAKVILMGIIVVLIAGCTTLDTQAESLKEKAQGKLEKVQEASDSHYTSDTDVGVPLNEYFDKKIEIYFERSIKMTIDCISGNCPPPDIDTEKTTARKCFFCENSTFIKGETANINIGRTGGMNGNVACMKSFDLYETGEGIFDIIEKTEDKIVVAVIRKGHVEQHGESCDEIYEYDWETSYEWIFYKDPPMPKVIMESQARVDSRGNYQLAMTASDVIGPDGKWSNYVKISCVHPEGAHSSPGLLLTEVNGVKQYPWINGERSDVPGGGYSGIVYTKLEYDNPDRTSATYNFASLFGGTYIMEAECATYYNSVRVTTRGDNGIELNVAPGANGDIPEDRYIKDTA